MSFKGETICGLKCTHDGSISLIAGNKLVFCVEMEKLDNNRRFSPIADLAITGEILKEYGYGIEDIDRFVIDGWEGLASSAIDIVSSGDARRIPVAPYRETRLSQDVAEVYSIRDLKICGRVVEYESYTHAAGHIFSAYCASPFAGEGESAYVMVWDGGTFPRMYYVNRQKGIVENFGKLFYLMGDFYATFASYFSPFDTKDMSKDSLSLAGKVMAYIAKGSVRKDIVEDFNHLMTKHLELSMSFSEKFSIIFREHSRKKNYPDADVLASMHFALQEMLIRSMRMKAEKYPRRTTNLCVSGGCGLNIKWNSAIRETGLFSSVFVPPFPNDSGSSIGAACASMVK